MVNFQIPDKTSYVGIHQMYVMTADTKKRMKDRVISFAFPGMGKTPLCKEVPGYFDADFGFFRTAMKVDKSQESVLLRPFTRLINEYLGEGYKILTNEPKLMEHFKKGQCVCYLPINLQYSSCKLGVPVETIEEWVQGWFATATRLRIPVVWLNEGLDTFLK